MVPLSEATLARIRAIFPPEQQAYVIKLIEEQCADNLPFQENTTPQRSERIRHAVLKLSEGNLDKLTDALAIAQRDWRDALVWAGFGNTLEAHNEWFPAPRDPPD